MNKISNLFSQFKKKQNYDPKLSKLEKKINYVFQNKSILEAALTHTSHTKSQSGIFTFERMEFLGDAVLGLIVSEEIFSQFENYSEGKLSKLKSKIVSRKYLNIIAGEIDLRKYLFLSSDAVSSKKSRNSILGNSMESLMCAIYLDGGIDAVREFIKKFILKDMDFYLKGKKLKNYKSILQEYTQSTNNQLPEYKIIAEKGPEHDKVFTAQVFVQSKLVGKGKGATKKEAHQAAAKEACEKLEL